MQLLTPDGRPTTLQAGDILHHHVYPSNEFMAGNIQISRDGIFLLFEQSPTYHKDTYQIDRGERIADTYALAEMMAMCAGLRTTRCQINLPIDFITFGPPLSDIPPVVTSAAMSAAPSIF